VFTFLLLALLTTCPLPGAQNSGAPKDARVG
jgi:hypothetical protein